ncbi:hypothetical protein XH98_27030 [Bradyrhizobium sp. CCBAU 51745]|nr:hypothetical protein [Bradyrhizobium sp. CCBAU 51745]
MMLHVQRMRAHLHLGGPHCPRNEQMSIGITCSAPRIFRDELATFAALQSKELSCLANLQAFARQYRIVGCL